MRQSVWMRFWDNYRRENTEKAAVSSSRVLCPDIGLCSCDCCPVVYYTRQVGFHTELNVTVLE